MASWPQAPLWPDVAQGFLTDHQQNGFALIREAKTQTGASGCRRGYAREKLTSIGVFCHYANAHLCRECILRFRRQAAFDGDVLLCCATPAEAARFSRTPLITAPESTAIPLK